MSTSRLVPTVLALFLIAACGKVEAGNQNGNQNGGADGGVADSTVPPGDAFVPSDAIIPNVTDKVYAHSAGTLFEVDPNNLTVTPVANFAWPPQAPLESMTDIAIDDQGQMIGISFNSIFQVDKATAECTYLADLQQGSFNGLSFVEGIGIEPSVPTLVGVNIQGGWWGIDDNTGSASQLGDYGGAFGSSGDVVFIRGDGTYATATDPGYSTDVLVLVNPTNGNATLIGEIGYREIWGVAYWGGDVFGFTNAGEFILIDTASGQGSLVEVSANSFWGAGVTTTAPIVN